MLLFILIKLLFTDTQNYNKKQQSVKNQDTDGIVILLILLIKTNFI